MNTTFQPSSDAGQTPKNKKSHIALAIATFGYSGFFPKAPGTLASILTVLLWWLPIYSDTPVWIRVLVSAVICVIGIWASERARHFWGDEEDPQPIVIDEVAGQSIALILCWPNIWAMSSALVLFRFFDILKPGPIGWLDKNVNGGLGIMLDDIAAGVASAVLLGIARWMWL